jgi:hypothetical protein
MSSRGLRGCRAPMVRGLRPLLLSGAGHVRHVPSAHARVCRCCRFSRVCDAPRSCVLRTPAARRPRAFRSHEPAAAASPRGAGRCPRGDAAVRVRARARARDLGRRARPSARRHRLAREPSVRALRDAAVPRVGVVRPAGRGARVVRRARPGSAVSHARSAGRAHTPDGARVPAHARSLFRRARASPSGGHRPRRLARARRCPARDTARREVR